MVHLEIVVVPTGAAGHTEAMPVLAERDGRVPGKGQILASRTEKDQHRQALMPLPGKEKIPFSLICYIQCNL